MAPWVMLAFERLLRRADLPVPVAGARDELSGAGRLSARVQGSRCSVPVAAARRVGWARRGEFVVRVRALPGRTGGLAPTLGLCAAAAADVPSWRQSIGCASTTRFQPQTFLRGFLFTDMVPEELSPNFTLLGSMAVRRCSWQACSRRAQRARRGAGNAVAVLFGFGGRPAGSSTATAWCRDAFLPPDDPVFLYRHRRRGRVAALGVEALADAGRPARRRVALLLGSALPVLGAALALHTAQVHWWHYASLGLCVCCAVASIQARREALLPAVLLMVIAVEIGVLRAQAIYFAPTDLVARPDVLRQTCFGQPGCAATTADLSINTVIVGFAHARSREAPLRIPQALAALSPMAT
jgi:hypothetical protein